jgi:hypothetical protein
LASSASVLALALDDAAVEPAPAAGLLEPHRHHRRAHHRHRDPQEVDPQRAGADRRRSRQRDAHAHRAEAGDADDPHGACQIHRGADQHRQQEAADHQLAHLAGRVRHQPLAG